jgi:hypothetical protein
MTDPPEDRDRPAQPAYGGFGGRPPAPPRGQSPPYGPPQYAPPQHPQQPYPAPQYAPPPGAPNYGSPQYAQPPYGQPPYGPYAPQPYPPGYGAPVGHRRTGLVWALAAVVVVAVAVAVVLSFTLRTRVLNRSAVERDVAAQFQEHEGVAIRLDCADSMALTTGAMYRCVGTTADGERVTLQIRVTDAQKARYTWAEQR